MPHRHSVRAALTAALLLVLTPFGRAGAAPPDIIGVVAVGDAKTLGPELAELTHALRLAMADRTRGVLSSDELRLRMTQQVPAASLSELDRAYSGAVAAQQAGDYEGAARALRAVVADLDRLPESEDAFNLWSRSMLRLARIEGSLGRKVEARDALARLVRAHPGVLADPELYPPSFVHQLDEVKAAVKASPRRRLVVSTGGRAARVFVEGKDAGAAPLSISLPAGGYRVSAIAGEVRASAGVVDLSAEDQTVTLDLSVPEGFRPTAGPGLAVPMENRAKRLMAAGGTLRLDRLLAATVVSDGDVRFLVGSLYDVRRGMLQREGRLRLSGWTPPPGGVSALTGFLVTGEPSSLVIPAPDPLAVPAPQAPAAEPAKPWHMPTIDKGWVAIGAGGLAVGLAAFSVYEGLTARSKYADARGMLGPDGGLAIGASRSRYDGLVSSGDRARTTAFITGGAAATCAITSGILGYLAYKQTGEVGPFRF